MLETTKPLRNILIECEAVLVMLIFFSVECQKVFAAAGGVLNLVNLLISTNQSIINEALQVLMCLAVGTGDWNVLS